MFGVRVHLGADGLDVVLLVEVVAVGFDQPFEAALRLERLVGRGTRASQFLGHRLGEGRLLARRVVDGVVVHVVH